MPIQRIMIIINLGLITLTTYLGVSFFYQLLSTGVGDATRPNTTAVSHGSQGPAGNNPLAYYNPIKERDLFQTQAAPQPVVPDQALDLGNLEETQLNLKLWGTVSGSTESAYAVIEDTKKKEQNLYRVDDVIQGATLKAILREKVVLAVQGEDQVLSMEKASETASATTAIRQSTASVRSVESGLPTPSVRPQRVSLSRTMIENAMQDVSKLMTEITITPNISENGQQEGLALKNIKPSSIFRRMGLRNGDVLVGVDGQTIESVDDALNLYENLKTASEVEVQILRRGQQRTIEYRIQ